MIKYCENCNEPYEDYEMENGICISCLDKKQFYYDIGNDEIRDEDIREFKDRHDQSNNLSVYW